MHNGTEGEKDEGRNKKYIQVKTAIPGPKAKELLRKKNRMFRGAV